MDEDEFEALGAIEDDKKRKDTAGYILPSPFPDQRCANCDNYMKGRQPGTRECKIVAGTVDPNAVCDFWEFPEGRIDKNVPESL